MTVRTRTSLAEFLALPETKPYLELMDGEVIEKPMPTDNHGELVAEIIGQIYAYLRRVREARLGTEVRHLRDEEEWVFLPDISVTLKSRKAPPAETGKIIEVMPDLAIEVLSPDDRPGRLQSRIAHYMRSGVKILWIVDPETEKVTVWRPGEMPLDYHAPAMVSAEPVLEDFELDLAEMFEILHS